MPRKRGPRTKHCRFYAQGRCRNGDSCSFIHDPSFQRQEPISIEISNANGNASTSLRAPPPDYAGPDRSDVPTNSRDNVNGYVYKKRKEKPCFAWRRGLCARGDSCWFSHDAAVQLPDHRTQNITPPPPVRSGAGLSERVSIAPTAGATTTGFRTRWEDLLRFRADTAAREHAEAAVRAQEERDSREQEHQARVQAAAREQERQTLLQAEHDMRELAEAAMREANERAAAVAVDEHQQRVLEQQERARLEEQAKLDATITVQRVILGAVVTFGAGLAVQGFITGFEACAVRVRGLPVDAIEREIYELFTQQGLGKARLHLLRNKALDDGTRDVRMVMDGEAALALSVGLDSIEFRDSRLSFKVEMHNAMKMSGSCTKDAVTPTISWPAATASYTASFVSRVDAIRKVARLNDTVHFGRRLKVEIDNAPPRHILAVMYTSIIIDNLPRYVSYDEVCALVRPNGMSVRAVPTGNISSDIATNYVCEAMLSSGCSAEDVLYVRQALWNAHTSNARGTVTISPRLRTRDQAVHIQNLMNACRLPGNIPFSVAIPPLFSYSLTIAAEQFEAQLALWTELHRTIESTPALREEQCRLEYVSNAREPTVCLRVSGADEKAVGAAKIRVEHLAAGEIVNGWDSRLHHGAFAERVLAECGAFMHVHRRQRQIRVYGSPQSVAHARTVIADELARLSTVEVTKRVPQESVRFLQIQGLPVLRELLGGANIDFNLMARTITVPGSDESQHITDSILEQASLAITVLSAENHDACPVCFDTVGSPVQLGCGHVYCAACLQHFLVRAVHSNDFPLVCMGDEARCGVPVALPSIMHFLSPFSFGRLLEAAFHAYIVQHPQELRYCRTADCGQVCRVVPQSGPRPVPTQCPACLDVVCPGCNEDVHEGSTCAENRARNIPAEQERLVEEWIAGQGGRVKKCPQCGVPVEKTAGCNHIECRCGAHICWRCMGVFDAGEIYGHMRAAHGSFYPEPAEDPFAGVDHAEQENMLRQAGEGRERQQNGGWCIVM